ncbi:MAG: alginate export family protein [Candidatus Omnitrophota bacterium]|nr:MAG: alginate export family protein [Candidatus Omnitrophota bacterium]
MRSYLVVIIAYVLFGFFVTVARGQSSVEIRRIEEEKRQALESTQISAPKDTQRLTFDYGGWIQFRYIDYENDDNDREAQDSLDYTYSSDIRLWLKAVLAPPQDALYENRHSFYLRLKNLLVDDFPDKPEGGYDYDGPHLDYAYFIFDVRPFWLQVGRHYFSVGEGIAYSNVNDGAQILFHSRDWDLKTFVAHTLPHEDNIDTSVPGYSKSSDRFYYGLEARSRAIPEHEFYGYLLIQRDFSNEEPEDPLQEYTYDSQYIGLGAQGEITPQMHYWLEVIKEGGRSRVFETNAKKDIDAWAVDLGLQYEWQVYSHPTLAIEYAYGSGDSERLSVTDTAGGNLEGKDANFLYFGYLSTGYALAPRLSNIHFYRIGASFKPFEKHTFFKNLSLGVDYYRYYKDKSAGGISDLEATESSSDIGSEIDVTLSWQIFSDLEFTLQYGHFYPYDAYPATTNKGEDYFSVSLTTLF